MADRLSADLDGINAFAGKLDSVRTGFDATGRYLGSYTGSLGGAAVDEALHVFDRRWSAGREVLDSYLTALAAMARDSVSAIRQADSTLAAHAAVAGAPHSGHVHAVTE